MFRQLMIAIAVAGAGWMLPGLALAKDAPQPDAVEDFRLANGLRVLLAPDHQVPTVAIAVAYGAGSGDEQPGQVGLAHFVEHMMFEGSRNLGPDEYMRMIHEAGGEGDGESFPDRTVFFAEVPSGALERVLWAEADRMSAPIFDEPGFEGVSMRIRAELMRQTSEPYRPAEQHLEELARGFAYGHAPTLANLHGIVLDEVHAFWTQHYGPGNAVLAIAGEFDPKTARAWVEKYFRPIPARSVTAAAVAAPASATEKRAEVRDPLAPAPMLLLAYPGPPARSPDWYAANLLATAMSEVTNPDKVQVSMDSDTLRGPSLLKVSLRLPAKDAAKERAALDEELRKIRAGGGYPGFLAGAQNRLRLALATAYASHLGKARALAEYALIWDDPRGFLGESDRYQKVTLDDVRRVGQSLLDPQARYAVEVLTAEEPAAKAAPAPAKTDPPEQPGAANRRAP